MATGTIKFAAVGASFVWPMLLSPVVAVLLASLIYTSFRQIRKCKAISNLLCLCVENEPAVAASCFVANSGALVSGQNSSLIIDNKTVCADRYAGVIFGFDLKKVMDALHFFSAGAVCFARGLNDTLKITALLLLAPEFNVQAKIALIAVVMAVGGLLNARRVAETMSHKITSISHGQGLSANLTTALLVIFASKLGLPVSTTHVSVGALFDMGLTTKTSITV